MFEEEEEEEEETEVEAEEAAAKVEAGEAEQEYRGGEIEGGGEGRAEEELSAELRPLLLVVGEEASDEHDAQGVL
jgi:hypothetical protein